MSASAVYVLDLKGKVLICRNYRGDVDMSEIEHFMTLLMDKEEEGTLSPILAHGGVRFMWIKHNNLYLVATSKKNACVSLVFSFLYKIVQVFSEYFKELEEESIRDNFVIIYELLDELMDFGYPQTTDSKILQEYITQEGHKLDTGAPRPPATVTNAVSWRSEGIKYRKNEVFLDVIESVNLLVSANGNVLRSEIVGSIKMRVFLSGMPELRLGLNDKVLFENTGRGKSKSVELEDVKFHQCVRLSRFENDRTISFIPPDGEFELMSYRLNTHVKPLIWIESVIEKHSHSRIEYMIKAKSQFKRRSTANNVEIHIPVPTDADSPKFKTTVGSVKWVPENSEIVWSIKSFPGGKEYLMRAHFGLPSVEAEDKEGKPPISVKFEIPYFTTSGIQSCVSVSQASAVYKGGQSRSKLDRSAVELWDVFVETFNTEQLMFVDLGMFLKQMCTAALDPARPTLSPLATPPAHFQPIAEEHEKTRIVQHKCKEQQQVHRYITRGASVGSLYWDH
ncbi:AP-1 complex subunit mu-1-like [Garra rufa]